MRRPLFVVLVVTLLGSACTSDPGDPSTTATTTTTTVASTTTTTVPWERPLTDQGLNVVLIWDMDQPRFALDDNGLVTEPWVRVHAVRDYRAMARMVAAAPEIQVTFNLTPSLLIQLEALQAGVRDVFWYLTETPAAQLTAEERALVTDRFFEVDDTAFARLPRLEELRDLTEFTDQDITDLQVLWNLAWVDPGLIDGTPLADLVARGQGFTIEDTVTVLTEHERIVGEVVETLRALWESGQIEISTSPLGSPILPLVADTSLARIGDPDAVITPFSEIYDAIEQVNRGVAVAERTFGQRPVGMWPTEGAVTQLVMSLFSRQGINWVASGERVLTPALGMGPGTFARNEVDEVTTPDLLYRPWNADLFRNPDVAMFFGDARLEALLEGGYGRLDAGAAAGDFIRRLGAIAEASENRAVVTIVVDDPLRYDEAGTDRIATLYRALGRSDLVTTVTPSRYLEAFGSDIAPLEDVVPGSARASSFAPWIGEAREASAWQYLAETRSAVARRGDPEPALDLVLQAEAGYWFATYGSDAAGSSELDSAFRALLGRVYTTLGEDLPTFLTVPLIPDLPAVPAARAQGLTTVTIDNEIDDREWATAARYDVAGSIIDRIHTAIGPEEILVRVDFTREVLGDDSVAFFLYVGGPRSIDAATSDDGQQLGFASDSVFQWQGRNPVVVEGSDEPIQAGFDGMSVEFAIGLASVGTLEPGGEVHLRLVSTEGFGEPNPVAPADGPVRITVGGTTAVEPFIDLADPRRDDHGPGGYLPPGTSTTLDLRALQIASTSDELVVTFRFDGVIDRTLSDRTLDLYIDTDPGAGTGRRLLLADRNAALAPEDGWEAALTVTHGRRSLFLAGADGIVETRPTLPVAVIDEEGTVLARIPLHLIGDGDPAEWGFVAAVSTSDPLDQNGIGAVLTDADTTRFGGAPEGSANHTRIIDLAWPGAQEPMLSDFVPSPAQPRSPDDVAVIELIVAQ
ncbi:MAG: hypothetical protein KJP12_04685 [Acidimicrobiia bacterium]|nr:hypothetical protein [Acidimicrobiia bacterium]